MRRTMWRKVAKAAVDVRDEHVWCHDSWRPVGVCTGRCYRNEKKCTVYKTFMEEHDRGKDLEKGTGNKGK